MIVAKFGGSSVADAAQIEKVRKIIESNKDRKIVIVSAAGRRFKDDVKITDLLYGMQDNPANAKTIYDRFFEIESSLGISHKASSDFMGKRFASVDLAASRGEYYSAMMIAEFLGFEFAEPQILINEDGRADEISYETIERTIKQDRGYVIPGFYGHDRYGAVKTFSRGGSDITGSIYARSLHADLYENWTDVNGVLATDPRIVKNPVTIPEMTYNELNLLGSHGAEVFHPLAVEPVWNLIPINIKNTNNPSHPGTMIMEKRDCKKNPVVSICRKDGIIYVIGNDRIMESKPESAESMDEIYKNYFLSANL